MSRTIAFLAFAVVLLPSLACAYTLNNINLVVSETGKVSVEEKLIVSAGEETVNLTLPESHDGLKVTDRGLAVGFEIDEVDGQNIVSIPIKADASRSAELTVSYVTSHLTGKSGGVWTLKFPTRADPYRTIIKVTLPQNTTIIDWGPKTRFTPTNDGLFVYPEVDNYLFQLNYNLGGTMPAEESNLNYYLGAAVLLLVFIALFLFNRNRVRQREGESGGFVFSPPPVEVSANEPGTMEVEESPSKEAAGGSGMKDSVYQMLDENEKKIVDLVLSKGEDITQAEICRETGIPKATLSDLMRNLEKRNVLERERDGRRNWVKLKKWVFK